MKAPPQRDRAQGWGRRARGVTEPGGGCFGHREPCPTLRPPVAPRSDRHRGVTGTRPETWGAQAEAAPGTGQAQEVLKALGGGPPHSA